jgi:hypothetical protein
VQYEPEIKPDGLLVIRKVGVHRSEGLKPLPVTTTEVPAGPEPGVREIFGAKSVKDAIA